MRGPRSTLLCTLGAWLAACSTTPPAPTPKAAPRVAGADASRAAPLEQAPPAEAPAQVPLAPKPIPDGCTTDVAPRAKAAPLMEQVAKSCIVDMSPVAPEPWLVSLEPGKVKELPFTILDPSRCVRAVATGAKEVKELELAVVDRSDQVWGKDELPGAIALANLDGPICFKSPGQYRAVVRLVDGSGEVAVQVWQTRLPSTAAGAASGSSY